MRLEARRFLRSCLTDVSRAGLGAGDVIEYWKSAPYLTNFMEGYKLKRDDAGCTSEGPKRNEAVIEPSSDLQPTMVCSPSRGYRAYEQVDPGNARLRALMADTLDREAWQLLWMPPSMPYYEPGPPFDEPRIGGLHQATDFLELEGRPPGHRCVLSYEAERRMVRKGDKRRVNTAEARSAQRGLLRFAA